MRTSEARAAFETFVLNRAGTTEGVDVNAWLDLVLDFYADERFEDVEIENDGDMLLFQWGTFDWGNGALFEYDLTRQLITVDGEDDDAIFQLRVTARFRPSDQTQAIGSGNRWCHTPAVCQSFREFINGSPATSFARSHAPDDIAIRFSGAG